MDKVDQIALVSGANRGIGLEIVRQLAKLGYKVILGSRELEKGESAARQLKGQGLDVLPYQLDVASDDSVTKLADTVKNQFGRLDVLVNNAAILYDYWQQATTADLNTVREAFETNTLGAWRMCKAFIPLLRSSSHGRIVNVSSELAL